MLGLIEGGDRITGGYSKYHSSALKFFWPMTWLNSNFDSKNFGHDLTRVMIWLNENCHDLTRVKSLTQKIQIWLDSSRVSRVNSSDTRMKYQIVKSGPFWAIFGILVHPKVKKIAPASTVMYVNLPYLADNATVLRITQASTVKLSS